MITISEHTGTVLMPKYNRNCLDRNNTCQLILQHRFTKKIYLYTVIDQSPLDRRMFRFDLTAEIINGEYTYYLVSYDAWKLNYIDRNYVPKSTRKLNAIALASNDVLMKVGNKLIVTGIIDDDPNLTSEDCFRSNMIVEMYILDTGILKMISCGGQCELVYSQPNEENEYVQYHG